MYFYVWCILKADACASSLISVVALKYSLKKGKEKIAQKTLLKAEEGFHRKLESVINARGEHIE